MLIDYTKADRNTVIKAQKDIEEINSKVEEFLENERVKIAEELNPLFQQVATKDLNELVELQAKYLSLGHMLNDKQNTYMTKLSKERTKLKRAIADRMEYYMTGFGIKTSNAQQTQLIDRDLAQNQRNCELLEIHIEFLKDCRSSCKDLGFSVKNRISLINYLANINN